MPSKRASATASLRYFDLVKQLERDLGGGRGWKSEAATLLGVDASYLAKIDRAAGAQRVGVDTIQRAAFLLGIEVAYFAAPKPTDFHAFLTEPVPAGQNLIDTLHTRVSKRRVRLEEWKVAELESEPDPDRRRQLARDPRDREQTAVLLGIMEHRDELENPVPPETPFQAALSSFTRSAALLAKLHPQDQAAVAAAMARQIPALFQQPPDDDSLRSQLDAWLVRMGVSPPRR